jgi:SPP1 family predicted phage head-tail adaptor
MPAGRLKTRVTFQSETRTPDGGGGHSVTWGNDLQVWADFRPERGFERIDAGHVSTPLAATLRVRYSDAAAAVSSASRVLIAGSLWNVRSVADEDQRRRYLTMTIESGVAT